MSIVGNEFNQNTATTAGKAIYVTAGGVADTGGNTFIGNKVKNLGQFNEDPDNPNLPSSTGQGFFE